MEISRITNKDVNTVDRIKYISDFIHQCDTLVSQSRTVQNEMKCILKSRSA